MKLQAQNRPNCSSEHIRAILAQNAICARPGGPRNRFLRLRRAQGQGNAAVA